MADDMHIIKLAVKDTQGPCLCEHACRGMHSTYPVQQVKYYF